MKDVFARLSLQVLQRDWLSSNQVVVHDPDRRGAAVVDTGYVAHAEQTLALVETALQGATLTRIFNTHLHSDHCGGNAALQLRWPGALTAVPHPSLDAVRAWDEERLTFRLTGQRCDRFRVDDALAPGTDVVLGGRPWQVHATGGHDADAVVLFEPRERVLISGDALWRDKVAVIFPELDGDGGFHDALQTLDRIEALQPAVVIPGHGAPFTEVEDALAISRSRLRRMMADPASHTRHALRVLMVFHLLEHRSRPRQAVCDWLATIPMTVRAGVQRWLPRAPEELARQTVQSLVDDGIVVERGDLVVLA